jgi:predicted anti-sigma-YlaC factor YlaD
MACFPDEKILAYGEGDLSSIEAARLRDHLLVCPACRQTADRYGELDRSLSRPVLSSPPERLVPQVMQRLYPVLPRYTSIAAMIAASFVFLITWIYIYFDFSSSSLIQALRLTTDGTSGWLADVIKAITAVYNGVQAVFKAGNALLNILLPAPLGTAVAAFALLAVSGLLSLLLLKPWLRKARARRS